MRIIFMGTPEFAVESLRILVESRYNVVAVVTMPDKPAGRGHKLQSSPVKNYAIEHNIPVLQPEKLKDEAFIQELKSYNADLQVVVAFRMLPEVVWNMPPQGTFNLHASLLPQYRGAAPINWAIIHGEKQTGATTFFLTHEIDTGKVILQEKIDILPDDDAGSVHDKLMLLGAQMVKRTVELIAKGKSVAVDQSVMIENANDLKLAPKIFKETCKIDIQSSVQEAHNFVRGLSPYPTAWTELHFPGQPDALVFKVYKTAIEEVIHEDKPGTLLTDRKTFAKIALKGGYLQLLTIQPPDKKRMEVGDYLRGLR
jgi:methionyl-tRNA formyltransferase